MSTLTSLLSINDVLCSIVLIGRLQFYDLCCLWLTCSTLYTKIRQNKMFLRQYLQSRHKKPLANTRIEPDWYSLILQSIKNRWKVAFKVCNIIETQMKDLDIDTRVFGGFIRDYVSKKQEFNDIDIWTRENADKLFTTLNGNGWKIVERVQKTHTYSKMEYKHENIKIYNETEDYELTLDVTSECPFGILHFDFTVNSLYCSEFVPNPIIKCRARSGRLAGVETHCRQRMLVFMPESTFGSAELCAMRIKKMQGMGYKFRKNGIIPE